MAEPDFVPAVVALQRYTEDLDGAGEAVSTLANASRQSATYRQRLADPKTLKALIGLIGTILDRGLPPQPLEAALRCVGNACIDNDEARQIVTDSGFSWATRLIGDPIAVDLPEFTLRSLSIQVLYNICSDFEPAQKQCYSEDVHARMLVWYYAVQGRGDFDAHFFELLLWICAHKQQGDRRLKPDACRKALLMMPHDFHDKSSDVEDFAVALEIALIYLRDPTEHDRFIVNRAIDGVWQLLEDNEDYISKAEAAGNEEDVKLLVPFSTSLTWCLSDIAANPDFASNYAHNVGFIDDSVVQTIVRISERSVHTEQSRLASAACQIYGNLLWSVRDGSQLVYGIEILDEELRNALIRMASKFTDPETLHSLVGLLLQLCRHYPVFKKRVCEDDRLDVVLDHLCGSSSKEVRQDGMKLLQLLGKDDFHVRERFSSMAHRFTDSLLADQSAPQ